MNKGMPIQSGGGAEEIFGFRDFLTLLFKHKGKILGVFFSTFFAVAIGTFLMTPTYETYSSLLVKIGREHIYRPEVGTGNPTIDIDPDFILNSEIKIANSPDLIQQVLESLTVETVYPEIAAIPPEKGTYLDAAIFAVKENLEIQRVKESDVIEIRFQHPDPKIAARVVNNLVEALKETHLRMFSDPKASFLEKQVTLYLKELNESKARLKAFKQKHGLSSPAEERSLLLVQRKDLDTILKTTQHENQGLRGKLASLIKQKKTIPERIPLSIVSGQDQIINEAKRNLLDRRRIEQELLAKYKDTSPLVLQVRKEMELIEDYIEEQESKNLEDTITTGRNPIFQQIDMGARSVTAELKALQAKEGTIRSQIKGLVIQIAQLDEHQQELETLEQRVTGNHQNYEMYSSFKPRKELYGRKLKG